ncbi:hypothetical protein KGQ19_47535 [Catenulispora sp. NL8]|uniref:Secreted protein n=1 Tax=Catenulispora pinistramenti TaxID=2705254 RepID=A0ABS5L869_9ACTN|nr:hypothetical protein [Catenulispora pinistramenti]MBS2554533.1 hypothetical protein [Catenulispora pinistramenti]
MSRRRPHAEPDPYTFGSRPYDLVKEFVIALVAVVVLTVVLAAAFSSPDVKPMTIAAWANNDPGDFTTTALAELDGSSTTAGYGPPYNSAAAGQQLGPLHIARMAGVTHPIDTVDAFVMKPLDSVPQNPEVTAAISTWKAASDEQQGTWTGSYSTALGKAGGDPTKVAAGGYGPVPLMLAQLLNQAQAGSLEGQLMSENGFYHSDYTLPLMFLADGSDLAAEAQTQHLAGTQWGMMNEVNNFPGQPWLAPYTFWYQISPYKTSGNGDALVWGTMGVVGAVLVLLPFIPGLRSVPRVIPVYRLIWRDHYRRQKQAAEV